METRRRAWWGWAPSWNLALVERVGQALAQEAKTKAAQVLLAPTVNIHRSPLGGRNFESFSDDPYLTSLMAVAYINGVQSQGIGATVKHHIANAPPDRTSGALARAMFRFTQNVPIKRFPAHSAGAFRYTA